MDDISASLTTISNTSSDTQSTPATSISTNDLLTARARAMGAIPPAIVRSNPQNDITPFCAHLWETDTELCRNVFDDEIPRPQPGSSTTTKAEDDAYVERFFDRDTILVNGYRFLKMALIAISQYNHTQIVSCANEYFDNDKTNQELFQDAGTAQQMRTTTDITSFFDKKFIDDHDHPRFLIRVMQYIQCNFNHFKETYSMTSGAEAAAEQVTTTPAGSPGRTESTERARSANDGRITPVSEVDIGIPASLEVPKSRNSQTPVSNGGARARDQAAASIQVESTAQQDINETTSSHQQHVPGEQPIRREESLSSNQRDSQVEQKSSRGAESSSSRAEPGSITPMHRHESRSSRELSAQRIKEFVPSQSRGHSSGSGRGYHTAAPRYEQTSYFDPTSTYNVPNYPAEYADYNTNQPQRNDQPRQNNRGRGGYSGRGRGRGQGSGNLHVLDHNKYQRLPAQTFQYQQSQAPFPPTAAERSGNWRQKENGPPTIDARRVFSDQPLSAPYGFGTDPVQQHMPFLPIGSGPMPHAVADRTNNSGGVPRHPYGRMMPPFQERSVSDGSSLEGRMESHVAISNIPDGATEDFVVKRVAEVLNLSPSECKIMGRAWDQLIVEINPGAAWSLVLQQPKVSIHGQRLRFGHPPRPPPADRETVKSRYPNRDRSRHNTEQYSGDMAPVPLFNSLQRDASFRPDFPHHDGPDQYQPGPFRGRPPVPDVYQPNVAFAGVERQRAFDEPFVGQYFERPDWSRGRPLRDLPNQSAGPSGKKNKTSPKKKQSPSKDQSPRKNAQRSSSYNDTAWLEQKETIVPEDSVSLTGTPDRFSQSRDTFEQPPGEVKFDIAAGTFGHKKVISTSSVETVKQKVSPKQILVQPDLESDPVGRNLNSPPPQSTATFPVVSEAEQTPVLKARLADETTEEAFLADIQAAAHGDDRRDTVHEALAEPKTRSSHPAEGLMVQLTPKRNLTPKEAGEDVDESFQTAHESPIEDKDDEPVLTPVVHEVETVEPAETSVSKGMKPEKEQEVVAGASAQRGVLSNKDNQQERLEQRNVSNKTAKKSDRPGELAAARPAKTESLSPFARQPKSKKKEKKPKAATSKGKEQVPPRMQGQPEPVPVAKQTQIGNTAAGQATGSSAAKDKTTRMEEAIKVDDNPAQEQDRISGGYINESERMSGDILLEASNLDSSVPSRFTTHDAISTMSNPDHEMPVKDKGKGSMYPDQTFAATTQIMNDTMSSNHGGVASKMSLDPAPTIFAEESSAPNFSDLQEEFVHFRLTKEDDAAESTPEIHQRSASQLSNVTESTQSVPGEKPKSKKKKKNKKKKAGPTDATAADEQSVEPADDPDVKAAAEEDDSDEGERIFTPPGSSVTDSPESRQGKTSRISSSNLLQAPRNTLQMRKQKQPAKPRKVSDAADENEVDAPAAGQSSKVLSKLGNKFGTNVEVINLSTSKAPKRLRLESPSRSDAPVDESVRKMIELKHRENIARLSKGPNNAAREEALRLEQERYEKECSQQERDNFCNTDDSQATIGATDTATSSETIDYPQNSPAENKDNDRGLTPAQAKFEMEQEQERLRREELDDQGQIANYYKAKNMSIGRTVDRDIWAACSNPDPTFLDRHTPGYGDPLPIPTHPISPPTIQDRMHKFEEVLGKSREYPGQSRNWYEL